MTKELEVKVLGIDKKQIENKLVQVGAKLISREYQINTLLDTEDKRIETMNNSYLRIREVKNLINDETKTILTLKENKTNSDIRENIEIDTEIDDKQSMIYILETVGVKVMQEGYKERTSYSYDGMRFDIDTWDKDTYPYSYMEIEVEKKEDLDKAIKLLDIDKKSISTKSIVELRRDLGLTT